MASELQQHVQQEKQKQEQSITASLSYDALVELRGGRPLRKESDLRNGGI